MRSAQFSSPPEVKKIAPEKNTFGVDPAETLFE
jgi:hypothetical protein